MNYKEQRLAELKNKLENKDLNESLANLHKAKEALYNKWGRERCMEIVSPELKTRFQRAVNKYNNEYSFAKDKIALNEMMVRAITAIDNDIAEHKHEPLHEDFIYVNNKKTKENFIICKTNDQMELAYNKYKHENVIIVSLEELVLLINDDFKKIKRMFHSFAGRITKYESINKK